MNRSGSLSHTSLKLARTWWPRRRSRATSRSIVCRAYSTIAAEIDVVVALDPQLGGVHGYATRTEATEAVQDEGRAAVRLAEVLERARRPQQVEVHEVTGQPRHVDRTEGHEPLELLRRADAVVAQLLDSRRVLARVDPGAGRFAGLVGRHDPHATRREDGRDQLTADAEADSTAGRHREPVTARTPRG